MITGGALDLNEWEFVHQINEEDCDESMEAMERFDKANNTTNLLKEENKTEEKPAPVTSQWAKKKRGGGKPAEKAKALEPIEEKKSESAP